MSISTGLCAVIYHSSKWKEKEAAKGSGGGKHSWTTDSLRSTRLEVVGGSGYRKKEPAGEVQSHTSG